MKCQKFTRQKIVGNLLDKFRKLYMNAWMSGHLKVCAAPSGRAFASLVHFGMESGMVFEGTTGVYECTYRFNSK